MTQTLPKASDSLSVIKPLPTYVVTVMCWLFAILFGVWALPHTVFIRHTSMVLGAILGLYVIGYLWKNDFLKLQKNAIPIFLILALFVWVTIHLLFIGKEPELQWLEYSRIWKKIVLIFPFALGLGLGLRYLIDCSAHVQIERMWKILYLGFLLPIIIFYIKYALTNLANYCGLELSPYIIIYAEVIDNYSFNIWKAWYVFFCFPAFAISQGSITYYVTKVEYKLGTYFVYFLIAAAVFYIFYQQSVRNGMLYMLLLVMISFVLVTKSLYLQFSRSKAILLISTLLLMIAIFGASISKHPQWLMFLADAKVAFQVDKYDHWKYHTREGKGLPVNEYGEEVNVSTYERISWGIVGLNFLIQNPEGYGLMTLSFDRLTKEKWPSTYMSMSHSGWLDFSLGYGIIGFGLLAIAAFLAWLNSAILPYPWCFLGRWVLGSLCLIMLTTELSTEIFINALIFIVLLVSGLTLSLSREHKA